MEEADLQPYLMPGEKLLWKGKRLRKFRFDRKQFPLLFIIPFFLFFLVCALAGIFADGSGKKDQAPGRNEGPLVTPANPAPSDQQSTQPAKPPPPLPVRIFFAFFVIIMLGGFFSFMATIMGLNPGDAWRGDVFYGITNQRLLIISGRGKKTARSLYLGSLPELRMKEWPDGLGQISFGPEHVWPYRAPFRDGDTRLENIASPREVFQILITASKAA